MKINTGKDLRYRNSQKQIKEFSISRGILSGNKDTLKF